MSAVVRSAWPVSDKDWGPVPPRAKRALARLAKKSKFLKMMAEQQARKAAR